MSLTDVMNKVVEADEESRESRKMDPEILCLSRIARLLDELDAEAQARVIAYLASRYTSLLRLAVGEV